MKNTVKKNIFKPKSRLCLFFLFILILFHSGINAYWLSRDSFPRGFEVPDQILATLSLSNSLDEEVSSHTNFNQRIYAFFKESWKVLRKEEPYFLFHNRPSLIYLYASIWSLLLGKNTFVFTFFTTTTFLIILMLSVYKIGAFLKDSKVGLIAAVLVSFYPSLFGFSRKFGIDYPLTAMTALSIYLLIASRNFRHFRKSVFLGIATGAGMLIKGQFLICFAGPLAFVLGKCIVDFCRIKRRFKKRATDIKILQLWFPRLLNLLIFISFAVALSSIWWWDLLDKLIMDFMWHASTVSNPNSQMHELWTVQSFLFYAKGVIQDISPVLVILALISFFILLIKRRSLQPVIFLWLIVPYLSFSFIAVKWTRFYHPALPALGIITALGISHLYRSWRRPASVFIILFCIVQFISATFGFNWMPYKFADILCHAPIKSNLSEIANKISGSFSHCGDSCVIGIVEKPDLMWLADDSSRLQYAITSEIPEARIYRSSALRTIGESKDFWKHVNDFDFIITISLSQDVWNNFDNLTTHERFADVEEEVVTSEKLMRAKRRFQHGRRLFSSELILSIEQIKSGFWVHMIKLEDPITTQQTMP